MRKKIFYSLADQDFHTTRSVGIFNTSLHLAASLNLHQNEVELTIASNPSFRGIPFPDAAIQEYKIATSHGLGRLYWDQIGVMQASKKQDWLFLPKGFASFCMPPTARLATYIHDTIPDYYLKNYPTFTSTPRLRYFQACHRASLRYSSVVFTNTEFSRQEILRFAEASAIVPPPVIVAGIGFFAPSVAWNQKTSDIVVVTGEHPHKKADKAIEYMQAWQRRTRNLRTIHWVGKLPKGIHLPNHPTWKHYERLPTAEFQALMQHSQVVVYFSELEGFGMPPVEAMLTGAVPVFSDIPAMREVMGETGFPFSDQNSFIAALDSALSTPPSLIAQWSATLEGRHSWCNVTKRIFEGLESVEQAVAPVSTLMKKMPQKTAQKTIGVLALSMSPRSGGIMNVYKGLMRSASASPHRYIFITSNETSDAYPENVTVILRPKLYRLATQILVSLPGTAPLLASPRIAHFLVSLACGMRLPHVDAWLWSHCFAPVPNIGKMMTIQADMIHKHYPSIFSCQQLARRCAGEKSLQYCQAILSISQSSAEDLLDSYPIYAKKTHVFPLADVETQNEKSYQQELSALKQSLGPKKILLFVAVDWQHKNHEVLIEAAKLLQHQDLPPFEIVFIGHRRGDTLLKRIHAAGVEHLVKDLGRQSSRQIATYYAASSIVLFPSKCEGFGIPLVEAMRYGKPILAGTHKCIREVGGAAPDYLNPDSPAEWENRIKELLTNDQQQEIMAERAKREVLRFSWENSWKALNPIFEEICKTL